MQTELADWIRGTPEGDEADAILRRCVHCGFCTATCPTYQLLGDELDGPRGRIYLIKQVLEGAEVTARTQTHLDRCLTCRACETTCPSGVQYGRLVDIGRKVVDDKVGRHAMQKLQIHEASAICFVSANTWDAQGAAHFGFQVLRVNRFGLKDDRIPGRPAALVQDLSELVRMV